MIVVEILARAVLVALTQRYGSGIGRNDSDRRLRRRCSRQ